MKLRFDLIKYMMAMLCMVFIAACTDDDDWQPGPQAKEGNQQVHFSASNDALALLNVENPDDRSVALTVERNTTEGALVVPVKVESQSEGLSIPGEVRFEDGQQTTTLDITVTAEAKGGTSYAYALVLDSDETDPYAQVDGSMRCTGEISFPTIRTAKMWIDGAENLLGYWHESVMDIGGGKLRIQDWMNSGINIDITIDDNNYLTITGSQLQEIYPDYWYTGDSYIYFNEYDYNVGDYVYYKFYPHGKDAYIWIDELCTYTYGPWGYSYYDPTDDNYSICFAWLKLNTESSAREWATYKFQFLAEGEEYEDYLPDPSTVPEEPDDKPYPTKPGDYSVTMWIEDYNISVVGDKWNETLTVNEDGTYTFKNWMESGLDLNFTIDDSGTYADIVFSSPQLTDKSIVADPDYGANYYNLGAWNADTGWYDFYKFYPYGKDNDTYIEEMTLYMGSSYSSIIASSGKFYFQTSWLKLSTEADGYGWYYISFTVDQ